MLKLIYYYFLNNIYVARNLKKFLFFKKISLNDLKLLNRNEIYFYFHNYFYFRSKRYIKKHRFYFRLYKRGYGEDAFHAMWEFIIKTFRPRNILEIGVYRGQTLTLFSLISKKENIHSEVFGISPMNDSDDSVSNYMNIDYESDIQNHHNHFSLDKPKILKSLSTDSEAINFIKSRKWDLIYIDGSHDYSIVKKDISNSIPNLSKGGIIVLDDSSLFQDFNTDEFAFPVFKGHKGPSKAFEEILKENKLNFLFGVGHNNIFINT